MDLAWDSGPIGLVALQAKGAGKATESDAPGLAADDNLHSFLD